MQNKITLCQRIQSDTVISVRNDRMFFLYTFQEVLKIYQFYVIPLNPICLFSFHQELHKYKENEKDTEVLMSALSAMQDKTQHLENSLSAETRIKLDLFSALGDAKRQLEIAQGQPFFQTLFFSIFVCFILKIIFYWWDYIFEVCFAHGLTVLMSVYRSDPAERPGDKRPKAEDS